MTIGEIQVDEKTRDMLGDDGLSDVRRCLWAADCQSCGGALAGETPALFIEDYTAYAFAELHHQRCRPAQWHDKDAAVTSPRALLSFHTVTLMLPLTSGPGHADLRPALLVNPGLEGVVIERNEQQRWRVRPNAQFTAAGLMPLGPHLVLRPVDGVIARLTRDSVAVTMQNPSAQTYEAPADERIAARARELGGLLFAVSHAIDPWQVTGQNAAEIIASAIRSDHMIAGWVALHGTKAQARRQTPPAMAGATFVVHWNQRLMSAGRLLGQTPPDLAVRKARSWAKRLLGSESAALLPWEPVDEHHPSEGWQTMNALSAKRYILRQHDDAWRLVETYSHATGTAETGNEAKAWAAAVIEQRVGVADLCWQPGPSTPGSATLYATT